MDQQKIFEAITSLEVSAEAKESGAYLVDHWIQECGELDARDETLGVEVGGYLKLDSHTFVVFTQDRIGKSYLNGENFGCEWKTTKHRTKFWGPENWFESISNAHQVATYALGLREGRLLEEVKVDQLPSDGSVSILVRAISKSSPPEIWPTSEGQFVTVGRERQEILKSTYLSVAEAIRRMREREFVPWAVPGVHCTNVFRKECEFLGSCKRGELAGGSGDLRGGLSPGSKKVVEEMVKRGELDNDPRNVVLSASSLSDWFWCAERWRRMQGSKGEGKDSNLDIGTVLHAGLAAFYEQLKKGE